MSITRILIVIVLLLCSVWSFKPYNLFSRSPIATSKWSLKVFTLPEGGWSGNTFSLREKLPDDIAKAVETNHDVAFWNKVKTAVDKIEGEGKQCSDTIMLQIMLQIIESLLEEDPERLFDFNDLDFPPPHPVGPRFPLGSRALHPAYVAKAAGLSTVTGAVDTPAVAAVAPTEVAVEAVAAPPVIEFPPEDMELVNACKETIKNVGATSLKDSGKVLFSVKMKLSGKEGVDQTKLSDIVKKLLGAPTTTTTTAPAAPSAAAVVAATAPPASLLDLEFPPEDKAMADAAKQTIKTMQATSMKDNNKVLFSLKMKLGTGVDQNRLAEIVKILLGGAPPPPGSVSAPAAAIAPTTTTTTTATSVVPPAAISPMDIEFPPEDKAMADAAKQTIKTMQATSMKDNNKVLFSLKMKLGTSVDQTKLANIVKILLGGAPPPETTSVLTTAASSTAATSASATVTPATSAPPTPASLLDIEFPPEDKEIADTAKQTIKTMQATSMKEYNKVLFSLKMKLGTSVDQTKLANIVKVLLGGAPPPTVVVPSTSDVTTTVVPESVLAVVDAPSPDSTAITPTSATPSSSTTNTAVSSEEELSPEDKVLVDTVQATIKTMSATMKDMNRVLFSLKMKLGTGVDQAKLAKYVKQYLGG